MLKLATILYCFIDIYLLTCLLAKLPILLQSPFCSAKFLHLLVFVTSQLATEAWFKLCSHMSIHLDMARVKRHNWSWSHFSSSQYCGPLELTHYWWLSSVRFKYKPGYRSCDLLKIRVLSLVENLFFQKNPLQDLLSSLNAVISTNESTRFITGHMVYNLAYT